MQKQGPRKKVAQQRRGRLGYVGQGAQKLCLAQSAKVLATALSKLNILTRISMVHTLQTAE